MFSSRNKKNNVYPCKPQFYYIKVEFEGAKLYRYVFVMQSLFVHSNDVYEAAYVFDCLHFLFGGVIREAIVYDCGFSWTSILFDTKQVITYNT